MHPEKLSRQLRHHSSPLLARRRAIFGLALGAAGAMAVIGLYQMGILKHLPEPDHPLLDADRVDGSPEAYPLQTPDAVLGFVSYGAMALLAAAGDNNRALTKPWLPLALSAKVAWDAAVAAKLTVDQWTRHRAFCSYCLVAAGATFAMVPLAAAEARAALKRA